MRSLVISVSVFVIASITIISGIMMIRTAFKNNPPKPASQITVPDNMDISKPFANTDKPAATPTNRKWVKVIKPEMDDETLYPNHKWSNNVTYYRGEKITITTDNYCQIFFQDGSIDLPIGTFEYQMTRDEPLYFKNVLEDKDVHIRIAYKKDRASVIRRDKDEICKITKNFPEYGDGNDMSKEEWTNNCIMRKGDKILIVYDCRDCIMSCIGNYRLKGKDTLETTVAKNGLLQLKCTANSKLEIYF